MRYSVFRGWHSPARGIKQFQWSWWPYLRGASSGETSRVNKLYRGNLNSGPTWTEKLLSLFLERKSKPSVLSAHGEEEEGISPNASQREESLAPYRTHCHVLMGSIIYFTQWLQGKEQGDQGFGRRAAVRDSQNTLGVFPFEFRWGQVAQNRHIQAASAASGKKQKAMEAHAGVYRLSSNPVGVSSGTQAFTTTT